MVCPFATLTLDENLRISVNGRSLEPQDRTLGDLMPVLYDPASVNGIPRDAILYRMNRNVMLDEHRQIFGRSKIRFDITVMAELDLGMESNKTMGHYHPLAVGELSYPEVYQLILGSATFLLQKEERGRITDVVLVEAKQGDALLIPPNYGHVTINSGRGPLVMSNLVSDAFSSVYDAYISKSGAAYYLLKDKGLLANRKYGPIPDPRFARCNLVVSKDIYTDFISCPGCFLYLNDPSILGEKSRI
jgi:glucose-6-phosphate isomerase